MEPNRRLSTSNQGLSAAQRSQGSHFVYLRSKDLFLSTNMAGLNPKIFLKEHCATPIFLALIWGKLSLKNDFSSSRNLLFQKLFLQKFLALLNNWFFAISSALKPLSNSQSAAHVKFANDFLWRDTGNGGNYFRSNIRGVNDKRR